jgi:hypothetical protein
MSINGLFPGYIYWPATALSAAFGFYVVLGSLYTSVYGQGLALRGPVGSMVSDYMI